MSGKPSYGILFIDGSCGLWCETREAALGAFQRCRDVGLTPVVLVVCREKS